MRTIVVCVSALVLLAGCREDETAGTDAETCAEVADEQIIVLDDLLTSTDGFDPEELADAADASEVFRRVADEEARLGARAEQLGCSEEEMARLLCERFDLLTANEVATALKDGSSCARP